MKTLSIDIETYSDQNLAKCGVYRYVESPVFQILLFSYSADGAPVQIVDLACGEEIPTEVISALADDSVIKWAFNANFERICLSRHLGYPTGDYLDPESWRCSMVWAATMGLPLSLEGVGAVLGLEKQKLTEGKELIKYFCQPCAPTKANGQRTRNLPAHAPDKWMAFKNYNIRDVETEMSIQARLAKYPVPDSVWDEYHIDQEINDRGVALDVELVQQAIQMDGRSRTELTQAMKNLTDLENPNSVQQMKGWLSLNGMETDTLGKKAVVEMLKTAPPELQTVLSLRQQLAKSSVKKYQAMETAVCADGRARGMFQFYGANRTGRWAGRIIQMQNLPQNHLPDLAEARGLVRCGDFEGLQMLYEDVPDTLSQLIRTAFVPQDDRKFIVADFSAIEARVIAWFAGEEWRQKVFAEGKDIYCQAASQMFGVPVEKHGINGHLRQKGKIAELACIAEGQLVLTNHGLIPIEKVSLIDKVWDGKEWVKHDGVIYKGEREVITYDGLTATEDHLVFIERQPEPIPFGIATASGAHLVQTGNGGRAIRLGENHQAREAVEQENEPLLCSDGVSRMRCDSMAVAEHSHIWEITGMPALFPKAKNPPLAGEAAYSCKTEVRKPECPRLSQLRGARNPIRFPKCDRSRDTVDSKIRPSEQGDGDRQSGHERELLFREPSVCGSQNKLCESTAQCPESHFAGALAVCKKCCHTAQSQEAYLKKYDALTKRYDAAATELERLQNLRTLRIQQDKQMALFIRTLKKQPEAMDTWNDTIWTVMVEKSIVHRDGQLTFVFYNGTEITVGA